MALDPAAFLTNLRRARRICSEKQHAGPEHPDLPRAGEWGGFQGFTGGDAPDAWRTSRKATAIAQRSWALQMTCGLQNTLQGCSITSSAEKGSRLAKAACRRDPCKVSETRQFVAAAAAGSWGLVCRGRRRSAARASSGAAGLAKTGTSVRPGAVAGARAKVRGAQAIRHSVCWCCGGCAGRNGSAGHRAGRGGFPS